MALVIHNNAFNRNKLKTSASEIIDESINIDNLSNFLLIVPTGKLTKFLKYNSIEKYYKIHNKPCGEISIFNLDKFSELIFDNIFPNNKLRKLSEPYRLALTQESAENAPLEFYTNNGKKFYYHVIERLSNIIYGLREDGITYDSMADEISKIESGEIVIKDKKKFSDIVKIFIGYENLLENKYLDPPALLKLLIIYANNYLLKNNNLFNSAFDELLHKINPELDQIAIYGFSEFKVPEVEFLSKFANSDIPVSIHLDFSEINGPLFGNLQETKSTLLTAGFNFYYTDNEYQTASNNSLLNDDLKQNPKYFLRRWLFNVEREIKYPMSEMLKIFEFETYNDEVTQISKLIKYLITNEKYEPSDIAVVCRDISLYSTKLRENFYLERIPANFSDRYSLSESQVIIAILSVLDTISGDYSLADVIKTIQSSFLNFTVNDNEINLSNLIQVSSELRFPKHNIRLNKQFWIKRITNAIDYLNIVLTDMKSNSESGLDILNLENRIKNYQKALNDFEQFSTLMPAKQSLYSPDEFRNLVVNDIINKFSMAESIRKIYQFNSVKLNVHSRIERDIEIESIEKYSRGLSEFLRILAEMIFIMNDRSKVRLPLADYISKLKLIISAAKYQTRDKQKYGVTVTAVEQIREIPFKVTILCGLNDSIFPSSYRPESFLGKELKDSEDRHLHSEQIQFYQFLVNGLDYFDNSKKKIYLTYTKYRDNYEITRSSFIDSLLKVTDVVPVQFSGNVNTDDLLQKYLWYKSVSNRLEIAALLGTNYFKNNNEIVNENSEQNELHSFSGYEVLNNYFQSISNRFKAANDNSFAFLDLEKDLLSLNPKNNVYSATDFETFTKCSYQYYSKKILKLKEPDITESLINSLEFGNIMHSALYKFYKKLQENYSNDFILNTPNPNYDLPELKPVVISEKEKNILVMLLTSIIESEFADIKFDHPFIKLAKREILGSQQIIGWAEQFIESELNRNNNSFPALFEFEFGFSGGKRKIPPVKLAENLYLKGKVDRVEFSPSISFPTDSAPDLFFTVVDYKSGAGGTTTNDKIYKGESFQTALYLLALKKVFLDYYGINPQSRGAAYYILKPELNKDSKKDTVTVLMPKEIDFVEKSKSKISSLEHQQEFLENTLDYARKIIDRISVADFSAKPLNANVCKYCSFASVCRINERQSALITDDEEMDSGE
jgi:ATP-dependent helicase/DNAse subunit B